MIEDFMRVATIDTTDLDINPDDTDCDHTPCDRPATHVCEFPWMSPGSAYLIVCEDHAAATYHELQETINDAISDLIEAGVIKQEVEAK